MASTLFAMVLAVSLPGAEDVTDARLRALMTEGWETGAFETARGHIDGFGEDSSDKTVALAIALTHLRHNLYGEARKQLTALEEKSASPLTLAALAWAEAAHEEHASALRHLARAIELCSQRQHPEADLVLAAAGTCFGYFESVATPLHDRAAYIGARHGIYASCDARQRDFLAKHERIARARLLKLLPKGDERPVAPPDVAAIELEMKNTVGPLDRKIAECNREYQRAAQAVATLNNQWKQLSKALKDAKGAKYESIIRTMNAKRNQIRAAEAKVKQLAQLANSLGEERNMLAAMFNVLLEKAKLSTPATPPKNAAPRHSLATTCEFPLDEARQVLLVSRLPAPEAKQFKPNQRIWTDARGRRGIVAQLVASYGDRVLLRRNDGKDVSINIDLLSHVDQDYLDRLAEPPPEAVAATSDGPQDSETIPAGGVQLTRVVYGAGGKTVDVTEKIQKAMEADPYLPLMPDGRKLGDPAKGQIKHLVLTYQADGQTQTIKVAEGEVAVFPPWPHEGRPVPDASRVFRVVAVRYGAGMSWFDHTRDVQDRVLHPGETVYWGGLSQHDPWYGVRKKVVVWFDYGGRRYVRTFQIGEIGSLLESSIAPPPSPSVDISATIKEHAWSKDKPKVSLGKNIKGFYLFSQITGNFAGVGEWISIHQDDDNDWYLEGTGVKHVAGKAVCVATELRKQFEPETTVVHWTPGHKPIKMIHKSEGFCFLSRVKGNFAGGGEQVRVHINPDDGFWYLTGHSQQPLAASATAMRLKKGSRLRLQFAEYRWTPARQPIRMISTQEGFCFISAVGGKFAGYGEHVDVVTKDGFWHLTGGSQQHLFARAYAVRVLP